MVSEKEIKNALRKVIDPEVGIDVVTMGLIKEVRISDGAVMVRMTVTSPFCPLIDYLMNEIKAKAKAVRGVKEINVVLDLPDFQRK